MEAAGEGSPFAPARAAIAEFQAITGKDEATATFFLEQTGYSVASAISQ